MDWALGIGMSGLASSANNSEKRQKMNLQL